jgi:hypothetical protein
VFASRFASDGQMVGVLAFEALGVKTEKLKISIAALH